MVTWVVAASVGANVVAGVRIWSPSLPLGRAFGETTALVRAVSAVIVLLGRPVRLPFADLSTAAVSWGVAMGVGAPATTVSIPFAGFSTAAVPCVDAACIYTPSPLAGRPFAGSPTAAAACLVPTAVERPDPPVRTSLVKAPTVA